MCNGTSPRTSQGGSIAILKPSLHHHQPPSPSDEEMRLLFSNQPDTTPEPTGTQVEFRGWETNDEVCRDRCWVVIHRDGDLSAAAHNQNPFFSFALDGGKVSRMRLGERLELGVGEAGIIGRRVSVVMGSVRGSRVVAEGIIGWN
ncbi:hypothetical protein P280DRAFT_446199 [Massarina eburnea CBS 473.64]|uniref:Uncharacterized protein n=1 Tax=Massarina eburnea CBS 473.64 TaxID=1395130 RepID=A0A6A6SA14_9PLEO|nr:hypothetical protein P280DRAFT_446199 [Massarina eburnea CBS 473.64]